MLKGKYVLLSLATALLCWQVTGVNTVNSGIVDPCSSSVSAAAGVVLVCPFGDGDPLSAVGSTVSLTVKDNTGAPVAGVPITDMWLAGCADGLLLCGGSSGSNADAATNALGQTTFSNEPIAGGCDTGLYAIVQGTVIQDVGNACLPKCLPVAARSPDYKTTAGCGAPDNRCPDSKVDFADYTWFISHYPTAGNPGAPYLACADYVAPFGAIGLGDFTKFVAHYAGAGHKCPV